MQLVSVIIIYGGCIRIHKRFTKKTTVILQRIFLIDFSESMLEELRKKNVYTKDYCGRLGDNTEPICGIPDGSYDVVVIAGGFAHGHLNIQVLRQAARALKEGPYRLKIYLNGIL